MINKLLLSSNENIKKRITNHKFKSLSNKEIKNPDRPQVPIIN